ncbi:nucleotidyltransferase family protein [Bradyrhizobium sp. 192]|uniref:nucleotidyltransferase family protein n=1 Tax=Bradyrhizobium sp. 192 TaxID=2782660 RepID=UPI001FFFA6EE|nr:nucleotidyltransferase family protein [Bradyrhizobium sp. 192]UPJ60682.1 nucleotidyltransferase family protein [Bradyrhizobium sp. 192]
MGKYSSALMSLCRCLRGAPPADVDWMSVVGLANQTLTTPALIDFVDEYEAMLPEDVCAYVRQIHGRNVQRNERLADQLKEAVVAMNERGVTPVLLKGAATLAVTPNERRGVRLMSDLDIMVLPGEGERAIAALRAIGYEIHDQAPRESRRWFVELIRSIDVGAIDLQLAAPGPGHFYRDPVLSHCIPAGLGRGTVLIPTPTYRALMLIIHDQFQDYGYWLGDLDLRHLVELRDLNSSIGGLDWQELTSHISGKLMRNAVETQLVALAELLGVEIPHTLRSRLIPRLHFIRQVMQARFPGSRLPFLAMTVLDLRNYRRESSVDYAHNARRSLWSIPKADTLHFLLKAAVAVRVGKV